MILLILILIFNILLVSYDNLSIFPLLINIMINNVVFILNIVFFLIYISHQHSEYGIPEGNVGKAYGFAICLIIIHLITREFNLVSKPFSDFFGYIAVRVDLNNLLNKSIKDTNFFSFYTNYLFSKKNVQYMNTPSDDEYEFNWEQFINSIPFDSNGIDMTIDAGMNETENVLQLKTVSEIEELYKKGVYKDDGNVYYGGSNNNTIFYKILYFLFELPRTKDKRIIKEIIEKTKKNIDINKLVHLLDRKYLISKTIWLLIIVIITQSAYKILIIRD